ncbi:putative ribonuclease H-like domain-containing protein [Tanacetum coccineum]
MKARASLLMALPNQDQLKFHSYQDAKLLMEAIDKRYGGNKESKKVQRTLLKQQYENFVVLSSETMDQTFDRNKVEIETISLDDLYNNLKIYELELIGSSSTSQNSQNVAFVSNSTNNTNNTNKADNTAHGVSITYTQGNGVNSTSLDNLCDAVICAFLASQPNSPQISQEDLEQLHPDDLEEMDLQWEMAMLTIRARRFIKRTGRKLDINGQRVGFDKSKVECYNCHKHGHFARECRFPRNQENKGRENNTRTIAVETPTQNALIAQDGIGGYDWSYQAEEEQPTNHALMAFTSSGSSSSSDSEVDSCSKTCVKAYATLKEQYDSLSSDYKKSQFNLVSYKAGLELVEARLAHYKKNEVVFEQSINVLKLEVRLRDNALNEYKMNLEKAEKEKDQLKQTLEKFQNSSKSLNNILENKSGSDKGYQSVPPPLSRNFIPRKPDLTFIDEIVESENLDVTTVVTPSNDKTVENKGVSNTVESNAVRMNNTSAPIIEDWNSDDESEIDYTVRPSTEKIKSVKTVRETDAPKQNKHHPRGNQRNWNNLMSQRLGSDFKMTNKACYVCGSFEHLHYVCDKKVVRPVWNNSRRVNHKNFVNHKHMIGNKCYLDEYEDYDGGFVSFGDGPTTVKEFNEKSYCLVVTDDFSLIFLRVLVIKPYNNTFYELIRGRPPLIDFMKPFGCPVTILNTRDHLGKFDGKAYQGYFVRYSVVSKAMRVFNKRTRIVKETLNIRFLENTPNVKGNGPDWLFDVDSLTIYMNYVPVAAGNKTNGIVGTKDNIVAGQAQKQKEPEQEYILIPLCTTDPFISQGPKDCEGDARMKPTEVDENEASDKSRKHDQEARSNSESMLMKSEDKFLKDFLLSKMHYPSLFCVCVSSMDNTGIFGNAYDDEDLEEDVDMNNVISSYLVLDTSFTKFHKDHPEDQVIGSLKTPVQTRHMTKITEEHGLFSSVHKLRRTNHKDF